MEDHGCRLRPNFLWVFQFLRGFDPIGCLRYCCLVDAARLGAATRAFRGVHLDMLAVNGVIDMDRLCPYPGKFTDAFVTGVLAHVGTSMVTTIKLTGNRNLTDDAFKDIGAKFPALTTFSAKGCQKVSNVGWVCVVVPCPALTSFDVAGCSHMSHVVLGVLGLKCPALRCLNICRCHQISSDGIADMARGCPNLVELNVEQSNIDDDGIIAVTKFCPALTLLRVARCGNLTPQCLERIASTYKTKLKDLSVGVALNWQIQDATMDKIVEHCSMLRKFSLTGSPNVSDDAFRAIAASCNRLTHFGVKGNDNLTEDAIIEIAQTRPTLEVLKIMDCEKILATSWFVGKMTTDYSHINFTIDSHEWLHGEKIAGIPLYSFPRRT